MKEVFKIVKLPSVVLERPAEEGKLILNYIQYAETLSYYQVQEDSVCNEGAPQKHRTAIGDPVT